MHSSADFPSTPGSPVALVAFARDGLEALLPTVNELAKFELQAEPALLGTPGEGETASFAAFADKAARAGVRLVIAAAAETGQVRALAAALTAPVIRVPVALDGSPAAALAALTDAGTGEAGSFATVALGQAGARNAALLAVAILALTDARLRLAWQVFREGQTSAVLAQPPPAG